MSATRVITRLARLLDVAITSPTDGEALTYDTATSKWINAAVSGSGGGFPLVPTGVKTSNYTAAVNDFVTVDSHLGAVDVTLPAGTDSGIIAVAFWANPNSNTTRVIPHSGDSIKIDAFTSTNGSPYIVPNGREFMLLQYRAADSTWYTLHGREQISEAYLYLTNTTTADVTTSEHGFAPKAPNDVTKFLDGTGAWSKPAGSSGGADVAVADGGTGASTAAAARTNLGLGTAATHPDTDFDTAGAAAAAQAASQPLDSDLTAIAALSTTSFGRAFLALADAAALRTAGGLVIGTDVEGHDTDLTTIAGLTATNDDVIQRKAGAWANRTIAQLLTDLAAPGTTFQPLDSDLTSIAALATTTYGRALLALADAAALRTAASLVIGTDVQAYDAELAALAGLTSAADKAPYFTGAGTAATTTLTSFIRTLLDDTDAATARATLGVIASLFQTGGAQALALDTLAAPTDVTTLNASTSAHGLLPKLPNDAAKFLDGTGSFSTPSGGGTVLPVICQGRLTLTSGTAITTADVTGAGTIYFTPFRGAQVALYDGSSTWTLYTLTEKSLALTLTSGKNYDVFLYNNAGTLTLELSGAWTNDTTRADALTTQDGIYVKSGATTRRYIGTIRASGTNTTEDSAGGTTTNVGGKRFVWNYYNRAKRNLLVIDTANNWSYTTDTWRQANNQSGNKVEYVIGLQEDAVEAHTIGVITVNSTSARAAKVGVGLDSVTAPTGFVQGAYNVNAGALYSAATAHYEGFPGIGYHYLAWLEKGSDGTCIFLGDNGSDGQQTGLLAEVFA